MTGFNEVDVAPAYGATQLVEPMSECTVMVFNGAVFYQLAQGNPPSFDLGSEHKLPPGIAARITLACTGIRFRLGDPTKPAKVTVLPAPWDAGKAI